MRTLHRLTLICLLAVGTVHAQQQSPPAAQTPPAQPPASEADDPGGLIKQGTTLQREGKLDEAIATFEQAIVRDPKRPRSHVALGSALDLKGRYADARKHFQEALELAPDEDKIQIGNQIGLSHVFEGDTASASKYFKAAYDAHLTAARYVNAASSANALGRMYLEAGDLASAENWYRTGYETSKKVEKPDPDQPPEVWEMRWHHAQSRIAARRGDRAGTDAHAADVLKAFEANPKLGGGMSEYYYLAGYNALHLKDADRAIEMLSKANQEDVFILALLAQAHELKGDKARARTLYEAIVKSAGHNLNAALALPLARKGLS
jgi:Tfp pilus assembly protein PilF